MRISYTLFFLVFTLCVTSYSQALISESAGDPVLETPAGPITEIEFEEAIFNFGEVEDGEIIQTVFTFTNSGNEPLLITNAKGSCGCTVPDWPKAPIGPGETGEFVVRFNSKNKVGHTSKRVTITANTTPANSYLTVKGKVLERKKDVVDEDLSKEIVSEIVSLKDFNKDNLKIYPNPASELINIELSNLLGKDVSVSIYNSIGERLDAKSIQDINKQYLEFDVSNYEVGMYSLSVSAEGFHRISKLFSVIK